jgi:hypothetical protein
LGYFLGLKNALPQSKIKMASKKSTSIPKKSYQQIEAEKLSSFLAKPLFCSFNIKQPNKIAVKSMLKIATISRLSYPLF